jgi:hypothetical protein
MSFDLSGIKTGLALVLLGLGFGIFLGIMFGVNEDYFKDFVAAGIQSNPDVHDSNSQDKIWRYAQRAHFHATGIAAYSIGLLLLLSTARMSRRIKSITSVLIGLGSVYPLAWLSMFILSPSIGRAAAHSHIATELFTYVGVIAPVLGFLILVINIFFGIFSKTDST